MCILLFPGSHILSGNVLEPRALYELFPALKDHLDAVAKAAKAAARGATSPAAAEPEQAEAGTAAAAAEGSAEEAVEEESSPYVRRGDYGMKELVPMDYTDIPLRQRTTKDKFHFLTEKGTWWLPVPPASHNKGNYVISLRCVWKLPLACSWKGSSSLVCYNHD
jgi:hypothetical protein